LKPAIAKNNHHHHLGKCPKATIEALEEMEMKEREVRVGSANKDQKMDKWFF
jgi:hypothetical protein